MKTRIYRTLFLLLFVCNYAIAFAEEECDCKSIDLTAKANLEFNDYGLVFVSYSLTPGEGHNSSCGITSVTAVTMIDDTAASDWGICAYSELPFEIDDTDANPFTTTFFPNNTLFGEHDFNLNPSNLSYTSSKIVITLGGLTGGEDNPDDDTPGRSSDDGGLFGQGGDKAPKAAIPHEKMCGVKTIYLKSVKVRLVNGLECELSNLVGDKIDLGPCLEKPAEPIYERERYLNEDLGEVGFIYPNPTSDIVNVSVPNQEIQSIQVLDSNGKLVEQINGISNETHSINTAAYAKGIYFLNIKTNKGSYTDRFLRI